MEGSQRFQKQSSYVQKNLSPTSVKNAVGRTDVGGSATEMSQFLGALMKSGPAALEAHNRAQNEKNDKLKEQGYLEYKNAKPSSLKKFRENAPLYENPYYKWGVDTADAEIVLQKKSLDFEKAYGEWKFNRPLMGDPEDLEKGEYKQLYQEFVDGWIKENSADLGKGSGGSRNDIIMGETFWPGMDAVIASKGKDNAQYEAQIFKEQTSRKMESSYSTIVDDPTVDEEMFKGFSSAEDMIAHEESVAETTRLIEQMAFNPKNLSSEDVAKSKIGLLTDQSDLLHEILGDKISTGGQPSNLASTNGTKYTKKRDQVGTDHHPEFMEVNRSTSDSVALDYQMAKELGDNYKKPKVDITTEKFKAVSKHPDSGSQFNDQTPLVKNNTKKKPEEEPPAEQAKSPEYKVQTWGVFSHMDNKKTESSFTQFQGVFSEALKEVVSNSNLPEEAFGKLVLKPYVNPKTGKAGKLQVQFEMPPEHILEQHPQAKELNKNLIKQAMQKGEVTTPLYNNGITTSHGNQT